MGNNISYNAHYKKNNSSESNGIKARWTNSISSDGAIPPEWIQVLGFTGEEMPSDKVPFGLLIMKVPCLSMSICKNSHGFVVLARKDVGTKTSLFHEYNCLVTMPHLSEERLRIGRVDDQSEEVCNYLYLRCHNYRQREGADESHKNDLLKDKSRKTISQLKFSKKTAPYNSLVTGVCFVREIDKKSKMWTLLAKLYYGALVKLQQIDLGDDLNEDLNEDGDVDSKEGDTAVAASPVFAY